MDVKTINVLRSIDTIKKDSKVTAQELKKIDTNSNGNISQSEANKAKINIKDLKEVNSHYSHASKPSDIVFDLTISKNEDGFSVKKAGFKSKTNAEITVMTIDPKKVDIRPIYGDGTDPVKHSSVLAQPNLLGAVNGPLYEPHTKVMGDMLSPGRDKYDDGYQYTEKTYHIAITKDGKLDISKGGLPKNGEQKFQSFVGGMQKIYTEVKNGKPVFSFESAGMNSGPNDSKTARTLVGVTKDNKLIFVTVGKRTQGHTKGTDMREAAEIMHKLGSVQAFNFDGGGSTHMIIPSNSSLSTKTDGREVKGYVGVFRR